MLVLIIVCAGVVLASLDLFIVNVALPSMARDLHERNLSSLSWVLNAYAIVYASLLIPLGRLSECQAPREWLSARRRRLHRRLGRLRRRDEPADARRLPDRAGRRRRAAHPDLAQPRPRHCAAPRRRHSAVRAWTAVGGVAAALGPVVGGLLVAASWRWVFLVNVPIGLAAIAIGWRRLPAVPGHPMPRPDALGAVLVAAGVGAAHARPGRGQRLGLGLGPGRRRARRLRGPDRRVHRPHGTPPQPAGGPGAVPGPVVHGVLDRGVPVQHRVRRDAALDRPVDAERMGLVGAPHRSGLRPRPTDGADLLIPDRRPADQPASAPAA